MDSSTPPTSALSAGSFRRGDMRHGNRGWGAQRSSPEYEIGIFRLRFRLSKTSEDQTMYDERLVQPMRQELSRLGIQETKTAAEVDAALGDKKGTALVIVNSVCGCAAGNARPAVAEAIRNSVLPDKMITVFAGN